MGKVGLFLSAAFFAAWAALLAAVWTSAQQSQPESPQLIQAEASPPLRYMRPVLPREGNRVIPMHAAPPDTNGDAGDTQYVQFVNTSFAVFDKSSGTLLYGPAAGNTLWQGSSLASCAATNDGDPIVRPIVRYDKAARRWVITQLSYSLAPPFYQCIAVSATSDATGPYYRYALEWNNNVRPDYPKVGVWPDGYYMTFNLFSGGVFFLGSQVCALDRGRMLNNLDAGAQCFATSRSYSSLAPWMP